MSSSLPTKPILGIGFVGKQNEPLFIHSFESDQESELELNLTIHSLLDIIDERAATISVGEDTFYLGFLSLFGRFSTYSMIGPTLIKVFCVLDAEHEPTPKDEEMKRILFSLHLAYMDYICNPFVELAEDKSDPVPVVEDAPVFVKRITRICETNNIANTKQQQ